MYTLYLYECITRKSSYPIVNVFCLQVYLVLLEQLDRRVFRV